MSIKDAQSFAQKALASKELSAKVLGTKGSMDQRAAEVVKMGAAEKLAFTADEIKQVVAQLQADSKKELSDADLEKISGGAGAYNDPRKPGQRQPGKPGGY